MIAPNRTLLVTLLIVLLFLPLTTNAAKLYVHHEALHTALIIPAELVYLSAPELKSLDLPPVDFIRFGWGDAYYYGNFDRHSGAGLTALFLPTASVMEVTPITAPLQLPGRVLAIPANPEQIHNLVVEISATFYRLYPEQIFELRRTGIGNRYYYRAHGNYHLLNNCNHWTARRLRFLGIRVHSLNSIFASSLMKRVAATINDQEIPTTINCR